MATRLYIMASTFSQVSFHLIAYIVSELLLKQGLWNCTYNVQGQKINSYSRETSTVSCISRRISVASQCTCIHVCKQNWWHIITSKIFSSPAWFHREISSCKHRFDSQCASLDTFGGLPRFIAFLQCHITGRFNSTVVFFARFMSTIYHGNHHKSLSFCFSNLSWA